MLISPREVAPQRSRPAVYRERLGLVGARRHARHGRDSDEEEEGFHRLISGRRARSAAWCQCGAVNGTGVRAEREGTLRAASAGTVVGGSLRTEPCKPS